MMVRTRGNLAAVMKNSWHVLSRGRLVRNLGSVGADLRPPYMPGLRGVGPK